MIPGSLGLTYARSAMTPARANSLLRLFVYSLFSTCVFGPVHAEWPDCLQSLLARLANCSTSFGERICNDLWSIRFGHQVREHPGSYQNAANTRGMDP